jgi:transglutaminase-like putative cysteine protease
MTLTISRYYQITTLLLLVWLFILSAAAGTVSLWFLIPSFAFCVFQLRPFAFHFERFRWAGRMYLALAIGLGVAVYSQDKDIVLLFSYSLMGSIPLYLPKQDRFSGYWMSLVSIIVLGLVNLLAGDSLAEFLLFIGLASTMVFSLNAAHLNFYVGTSEAAVRKMPSHYFIPFIGSAALGLVVGILLFVFFPRTLSWQNPFGLRQKSSLTGYSGGISLGGASINESQALAMVLDSSDLEFLLRVYPFLLIRGNSLDYFDGEKWSNSMPGKFPYLGIDSLRSSAMYERKFVRVRVYREPHQARAIFLPGVVHEAQFPRAALGGLSVDKSGNLMRESDAEIRYSYDLTISPTRRPELLNTLTYREYKELLAHPEKLRFTFSKNRDELNRYLQIPEQVASAPYFKKWKDEVYQAGPNDPLGLVFLRLARHFKENFRVGYESAKNNVDSLESFVAVGRYGHCEYFATASVLFLRSLGIPSRIALGYRGGELNSVSRVLEVRESSAHAWVEAYLPDLGWLLFDPTPVIVKPVTASWVQSLGHYYAAIKFWLERYLVDYDSETQNKLFQEIRSTTKAAPSNLWRGVVRKRETTVLGIALFTAAAFYFWRKRKRKENENSVSRVPRYYRDFTRLLARNGILRMPGETLSRFHARARESAALQSLVATVDVSIERDLYSRHPLPAPERRKLRQAIRKSRPRPTA